MAGRSFAGWLVHLWKKCLRTSVLSGAGGGITRRSWIWICRLRRHTSGVVNEGVHAFLMLRFPYEIDDGENDQKREYGRERDYVTRCRGYRKMASMWGDV